MNDLKIKSTFKHITERTKKLKEQIRTSNNLPLEVIFELMSIRQMLSDIAEEFSENLKYKNCIDEVDSLISEYENQRGEHHEC